MNLPDEELQNHINGGLEPEGYPDSEIKSYQHIFSALGNEPEYRLPENFAEKIIDRVSAKNKTALAKDPVWLFLGISMAGILILDIIAIFIAGLKINIRFPGILTGNWGILLLGGILIALIQFMNRKFIRPKYF